MKKTVRNFMAACLALSAVAACEKENKVQTSQDNGGYIFTLSSPVTKTTLNDGESIKWEESDKIGVRGFSGEVATPTLIAFNNISLNTLDGNQATIKMTKGQLPEGSSIYILRNQHGGDAKQTEYYAKNSFAQSAAGVMNPEMIQLKSEKIIVPAAGAEDFVTIDVKMNIVGSIYRYLVYSSTGKYSDETIKSVTLMCPNHNIAGPNAVIGYNFVEDKYHGSDAEDGKSCKIFYGNDNNSIITSLTTPAKVAASINDSKGIYMNVAPIKINGYKYIVETDKATYTFDASDKEIAVSENTLKNVKLDLENEKVARLDFNEVHGELRYNTNMSAAYTIPAVAQENDLFYRYATIFDLDGKQVGGNIQNTVGNEAYYDVNIDVTYEGGETGWLTTVGYKSGSTHVFATATANEGTTARVAHVKITYPAAVKGYSTRESDVVAEFTITQKDIHSKKELTQGPAGLNAGNTTHDKSAEAYWGMAWYCLAVDGKTIEGAMDEVQTFYGQATFVCVDDKTGEAPTWFDGVEYKHGNDGTLDHVNDTWWMVKGLKENNTGVERTATVTCTFPSVDGYEYAPDLQTKTITITQKAE